MSMRGPGGPIGPGTAPAFKKSKLPPPEDTGQESGYLKTLGEKQAQVTVKLVGREAGVLLLEYARRGVQTEYKGEADLVTAADRASEKLIVGRLRSQFPKHDIFGEEGTRDVTGSDYRWHIDPLDGTTNFAHGYPA